MRYVGLDAHLRQSTFCVLDARGRKIMTRTVQGPWAAVVTELGRIEPPTVLGRASNAFELMHSRYQAELMAEAVGHHPGAVAPCQKHAEKEEDD